MQPCPYQGVSLLPDRYPTAAFRTELLAYKVWRKRRYGDPESSNMNCVSSYQLDWRHRQIVMKALGFTGSATSLQ